MNMKWHKTTWGNFWVFRADGRELPQEYWRSVWLNNLWAWANQAGPDNTRKYDPNKPRLP